jgi:hypothetical protein
MMTIRNDSYGGRWKGTMQSLQFHVIWGSLRRRWPTSKITVHIAYSEGTLLSKWPEFKPKPPRRTFEPSDTDLARLLGTAMPENLRRWILNSMATGRRPEAVLDLRPSSRISALGLIGLNPQGDGKTGNIVRLFANFPFRQIGSTNGKGKPAKVVRTSLLINFVTAPIRLLIQLTRSCGGIALKPRSTCPSSPFIVFGIEWHRF